jgi:PIN domain nuclease of toxin-antitoxin system
MRRLLLDTHTLLWWLADDPQLGQDARGLVADAANEVYVSAASAWEISIKKAGELPPLHRDPFDRMLIAQAQAEGLDIVTSDAMFAKYGVKTINASR